MAQDFAKQRNSPSGGKRKPVRAATKGPPPNTAPWSWFFSGLMSGVIVTIVAYLAVLKLEENVTESAQGDQASANPADLPTFDFAFYRDLATAEVAVSIPPGAEAPGLEPAAGTAPASVASSAENPVPYLLQAGSFQNEEDAESRRARIILLNMNASVTPGVVQGRTRYRVMVGPFAGRQHAEAASAILSENSIESIPLLMR
jgi:cell division protein FtsN